MLLPRPPLHAALGVGALTFTPELSTAVPLSLPLSIFRPPVPYGLTPPLLLPLSPPAVCLLPQTHAAMEPATHFRRLPLPSACWAALQWRAQPPAPVSAAEAAWLAERLQPPPTMMASTQPPHAPLQQMQQAEAAVVEARQVPGGWGDGTDLSAARSMACPQQEPEAAAPAPKGAAAAVPRGLVEFAREGHPCPGAATRLWLNPAFPGTPCVEKAFGG